MAAPTATATVTSVFTGRPPWGESPVCTGRDRAAGGRRVLAGNGFAGGGRMFAVSPPPPAGPFAALPPQVDLPALEQQILQRWEADKVFARSLESSAGKPQWNF